MAGPTRTTAPHQIASKMQQQPHELQLDMPSEISEAAEGKIWIALIQGPPLSVGDLSSLIDFTPQYTRKALRHLEHAGLAQTIPNSSPTLWAAQGNAGEVIRFVKTRDSVASSRARRANCIRMWRHLHRQGASLTIAALAENLEFDGPTVQATIRQLRMRGAIAQADIQPSGRSIALVARGTQDAMLDSLTRLETSFIEEAVPRFPRVNSVWALGSIA